MDQRWLADHLLVDFYRNKVVGAFKIRENRKQPQLHLGHPCNAIHWQNQTMLELV